MRERLAMTGYSLLWWLLTPLILLRLLLRSRRQPAYRERLGERFGIWPNVPTGCFWVHAVSVGETMAARPLIEQWQSLHPNVPILVTTMTPTGSETVRKLFGTTVHHAYLPWDFASIQRRLVARLKPKMLVIMETELWPNLIRACAQQQVPVLLANARLSAKSQQGYRKLSWLTRPMLQKLTGIAAQHSPDADRFAELGLDERRIQVTGSIKFDISLDAQSSAKARKLKADIDRRPIWIAASTHEGEDEALLRVHAKLKIKLPNALLILVPRHPERADRIAGRLYKEHFNFARRSNNEVPRSEHSVYLVDTLGELMTFFELADAAFIGNSLNGGGGHNPIEPAAVARPVLIGPSYFNFQSIIEAMRSEQSVVIIESEDELKNRLLGLMQSKDLRDTYGQRAYLFYQQQQGALKRLMTWIEDLIDIDTSGSPKALTGPSQRPQKRSAVPDNSTGKD
ncbi:lipid IV(A) 3-deoxy-D-manno-octulosonic acid transferase [Reinekea blandensis]|uniref:3-deoxy-D-manno-octulosonic acid transferase n=1 Tax=Reinekea blandensis MED297 TaxID=314283 RepID=A4BKD2_9GAMM|nr:lipid IV(A) 3-deoxy-D-manno-octulosonic acid transferase [Reinekea blandensis]EAR07437.1 3-deoxy-D-manno-octulosonic-acid transferase [Reinekea sp. MED297] [Reinekea blandensis MED297]